MTKGGVLRSVVEEMERDMTGSELSIPDETSGTNYCPATTENNKLMEETPKEHINVKLELTKEDNAQITEASEVTPNPVVEKEEKEITDSDNFDINDIRNVPDPSRKPSGELENDTIMIIDKEKPLESDATDALHSGQIDETDKTTTGSNDVSVISHLSEDLTNQFTTKSETQGNQGTSEPSDQNLYTTDDVKTLDPNASREFTEKGQGQLLNEESIECADDNAMIDENTNESLKGQVIGTKTNDVAELTKENLQYHTITIREAVQDSQNTTKVAGHKEINASPMQSRSDLTNKTKLPKPVIETPTEKCTQSETEKDEVPRSSSRISLLESKAPSNKERSENIENSSISGYLCSGNIQKHHRSSHVKRKAKKKQKISVDNVETLVARDKRDSTEKEKHKKDMKPMKENTTENISLAHEDSGIEKDIGDSHEIIVNMAEHSGSEGRSRAGEEPVSRHKRLLRRPKAQGYARRPVYDATNSSTKMILLNNAYGKHSRLWKSISNQQNRGNLINPSRHLREKTFYLSGDFHSRCSTTDSAVCHQSYISFFKFDFSDRPKSDKIGDRLYEARMSVNPRRHRACSSTPKNEPKPLDFSKPYRNDTLPTYVFEWERLYAEPPTRPSRPSSLVRLPSAVSGKNFGKEVVKIPHGALTVDRQN